MAKKATQKYTAQQAAERLAKIASGEEAGVTYTPERLEILKHAKSSETFGVARSSIQPKRFSKAKYAEVTDPLSMSYDEMEAAAQKKQTGWEVTGNAAAKFFATGIGGLVEGFAPLDVPSMVSNLDPNNDSKDFGNGINSVGQWIQNKAEENFTIFNADPENMLTGEYWASMIGGQGYTFGIMGSIAIQAAIGNEVMAGLNSLKFVNSLTKGIKALKGIKRMSGLAKMMTSSKAGRVLASQALKGTYNGLTEAYLNTLETGREEFEKYRDHLGEEAAIKKARESMNTHFQYEVFPAVALNAISWGVTSRLMKAGRGFGAASANVATGYSDIFETLVERAVGKAIKNPIAKKGVAFLGQMASESFEEAVQFGAGSWAQYTTDKEWDVYVDKEGNFSTFKQSGKGLGDYIWNTEMRDSSVGGAFGGALFAGFRTVQERRRTKDLMRGLDQDFENIQSNLTTLNKHFREVATQRGIVVQQFRQEKDQTRKRELGNVIKIYDAQLGEIREALEDSVVLPALQIDYHRGDGNFTTYNLVVSRMEEAIEAVKNDNQEKLKELGFEDKDSQEYIKKYYPAAIKRAGVIRDTLVSALDSQMQANGREDLFTAQQIVKHTLKIEENGKMLAEINRQLYDSNAFEVSGFDSDQQYYLRLISERAALESLGKELTAEQKERREQLNTIIEEWLNHYVDEDGNRIENKLSDIEVSESLKQSYIKQAKLTKYIADSQKEIRNLANEEYAKAYKENLRKKDFENGLDNVKTLEKAESYRNAIVEAKKEKDSIFSEEELERLEEKANKKVSELQQKKNDAAAAVAEAKKKAEQEKKSKEKQEKAEAEKNQPVEGLPNEPAKRPQMEEGSRNEIFDALEEEAKNKGKAKSRSKSRSSNKGKSKSRSRSKKDSHIVVDNDSLFGEEKGPERAISDSDEMFSPVKSGSSFKEVVFRNAQKFITKSKLEHPNREVTLEDFVLALTTGSNNDIIRKIRAYLNPIAEAFNEAKTGKKPVTDAEIKAVIKEAADVEDRVFNPIFSELAEEMFAEENDALPKTDSTSQKDSGLQTKREVETVKETVEVPQATPQKERTAFEQAEHEAFIASTNEDGTPVKYAGRKTAAVYIKVPFLGIRYKVTFSKKENGMPTYTFEKDEVAEANYLLDLDNEDKKEEKNRRNIMLNPFTAKEGTRIKAYIPKDDELKNEIVLEWKRDENGGLYSTTITFGEWVKKNGVKRGSDEWLAKVPIKMLVEVTLDNGQKEWVPASNAIHEVDWWNERNVADFADSKKAEDAGRQEAIIEAGRKLTLETRRRIFSKVKSGGRGVYADMVVTKYTAGSTLKIDRSAPARPVSVSNNQVRIVPFVEYNGVKGFPASLDTNGNVSSWIAKEDILNYDSISKRNSIGAAYTLVPVEVREDGRVVYLAQYVVDNKPEAQKILQDLYRTKSAMFKLMQKLSTYGTVAERHNSAEGRLMKDALKKIGLSDRAINSFIESPSQAFLDKNVFGMYPEKDSSGSRLKASVNKKYLTGDKNSGNLVVYRPSNVEGEMGSFELYQSEDALLDDDGKPSDSSYVQMLKDTLYSDNDYLEIDDIRDTSGKGRKIKVAAPQPRVELGFVESETKSKEKPLSAIEKKPSTSQKTTSPNTEVSEQSPKDISEEASEKTSGEVSEETSKEAPKEANEETSKEIGETEDETEDTVETEEGLQQEVVRDDNGNIVSISAGHRELILQALYNNILKELSGIENPTENDIRRLLRESITKYFADMKDDPNLQKEYEYLINHQDEILGLGLFENESGTLSEILTERLALDRDFFSKVDDDVTEDSDSVFDEEENGMEKDYAKDNLEYSAKTSLSDRVKIAFSAIPKPDARRTLPRFGNIKEYMDIDDVFSALQDILADSSNDVESMTKRVEELVRKNGVEYGFLRDVLETFNNLPPQFKFEILFRLNQNKISMQFVYATESKGGLGVSYKLQVLDANSRNPMVGTLLSYKENLKNSSLLVSVGKNTFKFNEKIALDAIEDLDSIIKSESVDIPLLANTLSLFGIDIYQDVLENMMSNPDLANKLKNGLFKEFKKNLQSMLKTQQNNPAVTFDITKNMQNPLLRGTGGYLKQDFIYNVVESTFNVSQSMYIAGKTINSFSQPNLSTEQMRKIKDMKPEDFLVDEEEVVKEGDSLVKKLLGNSYSKHSLFLKLVNNIDEKTGQFTGDAAKILREVGVSYASLDALKRQGFNTPARNSVTQLSSMDFDIFEVGAFMHKGIKIVDDRFEGVAFRMANMMFPALSDSSQVMLANLPVMDLNESNFIFEDGSIRPNSEIVEILFSQLVAPELERIVDVNLAEKADPNRRHPFEDGGKIFLSSPSLNMVKNADGKTILEYLRDTKLTGKHALLGVLNEQFGEAFREQIVKIVTAEKDGYLSSSSDGSIQGTWVDNGFITKSDESYTTSIVDNSFVESKAAPNKEDKNLTLKRMEIAAFDFAINTMIAKAQIQMLFSGDIANYAKFKTSKFFTDGDIATPKNAKTDAEKLAVYKEISSLSATNLSKRLKGNVSPGNRIANSRGKKYYQLMIEDVQESSANFQQYAELWYKDKVTDEDRSMMKDLTDKTNELNELKARLGGTRDVDSIYTDEIQRLEEEIKDITEILSDKFPSVASYLENTATDAQEYVTWREHLDLLRDTGSISMEKYNTVKKKLESQSRDGLNENNRLTEDERVAFQPMKPLHSGMYFDRDAAGRLYQKEVFVKSSAFPLLPEMTVGTKLDNLRQNMENLEQFDSDGNVLVPVRASFQTANKVGAVKTPANFHMLTDRVLERGTLDNSVIMLDRENFSIQQDKPNKTAKNLKNGKRDEVGVGTQIEKILLGSGINKGTVSIFPNKFEKSLLDRLDITPSESGLLTGSDLHKIYTHLYTSLEKAKIDILLDSLNIDKETFELGSVESMERLQDALSQRLSNKQDMEILELRYLVENEDGTYTSKTKEEIDADPTLKPFKAEFSFPLWLSPNARKFESVLNAIIGNELVKLKLPGNSFVVGTSQGISIPKQALSSVSEDVRRGIVWTPSFDPEQTELLPEREENGVMKPAQVVIASKFRKRVRQEDGSYKEVLIDLRDSELLDEDGLLDLDKVDPSVLELMSFRIPTSAHQSGSLLEVVGFLPPEATDLMLVPKEHTTKLGEDYDIDARYTYSGNFDIEQDKNGNVVSISFLDSSSIDAPINSIKRAEYKKYRKALEDYLNDLPKNVRDSVNAEFLSVRGKKFANAYIEKSLALLGTDNLIKEVTDRGEIPNQDLVEQKELLEKELQEMENANISKFFKDADNISNVKEVLNTLLENFQEKKSEAIAEFMLSNKRKRREIAVIENDIIGVYKSVYSSSDTNVRKLINSTINTDLSDVTAKEMDKVVSEESNETFSLFTSSHQKSVMRLGASGKLGIGVHSNWVVFNGLIQQLEQPLTLQKFVPNSGWENYRIRLGNFVSDGELGRTKALEANWNTSLYFDVETRTTADINMENQNSSTDNQNKGVMGRRNENKYTINVFALLSNLGFDKDIVNGVEMHLPSLFINQPIIRRYVELMEENASQFSDYNPEVEASIRSQLFEEFGKDADIIESAEGFKSLDKAAMELAERDMTAQGMFDNLKEPSGNSASNFQVAILTKFLELQEYSEDLNKIIKLSNMRGLGKSYFDVLATRNGIINEMFPISDGYPDGVKVLGVDQLFGEQLEESLFSNPESEERFRELLEDGWFYLGTKPDGEIVMRKPNSANSAKILSTLSTGYNLWSNIFPYENDFVSQQIEEVLASTGKDGQYSARAMDIRYDVKNSMQEFFYSFVGLGSIFEGITDINEERSRLFMDEYDSENNLIKKSLATYLNGIKMLKNKDKNSLSTSEKEALSLFESTFFKNLIFEITRGEPSIIKYNISSTNSFNKNRPHQELSQMLDSEAILPAFNGNENYTVGELLKDLTKYALLANPENGAIGFRNHIPMSVFKKYGIDKSMLQLGDVTIAGGRYYNLMFNGTAKSIASISNGRIEYDLLGNISHISLGSEGSYDATAVTQTMNALNKRLGSEIFVYSKDADGNTIILVNDNPLVTTKGRFTRQYYQHNPDKATRYQPKDIGVRNASQVADISQFQKTFPFSVKAPEFIVVSGKNGQKYLFEATKHIPVLDGSSVVYRQINKLGGHGVNEYNPRADVNTSMFPDNMVGEKAQPLRISGKKESASQGNHPRNVVEAVNQTMEIPTSTPAGTRAKYLLDMYMKEGLLTEETVKKFSLKKYDKYSTYGSYNRNTGTITMNSEWLGTEEYVIALAEEVTHAIVSQYTDIHLDYTKVPIVIDANGKVYVNPDVIRDQENLPETVAKFLRVYSNATDQILESLSDDLGITKKEVFDKAVEYRNWLLSKDKTLENKPRVAEEGSEAQSKFEAIAYRITNIDEFIAGAVDDEVFKKELSNHKYKSEDKSLLDKIVEYFKDIIDNLLTENGKGKMDEASTKAVLGLLTEIRPKKTEAPKSVKKPRAKQSVKTDTEAEKLLRDTGSKSIDNLSSTGESALMLRPVSDSKISRRARELTQRERQKAYDEVIEKLKEKGILSKHRKSGGFFVSMANSKKSYLEIEKISEAWKKKFGINIPENIFLQVTEEYSTRRGMAQDFGRLYSGNNSFKTLKPNETFWKAVENKIAFEESMREDFENSRREGQYQEVDGEITPYTTSDFTETITKEEFTERLLKDGVAEIAGEKITKGEFDSMTKEEQKNLLACL